MSFSAGEKGTMLVKFNIKNTFCPEYVRKNLGYSELEPCRINNLIHIYKLDWFVCLQNLVEEERSC